MPDTHSNENAPRYSDAHIICTITGSGFKDPHSVEGMVAALAGAPLASLDELPRLH